ncbi:MAG: aminoacyl--tRNA ligase-related protein [Nanoarchaeota archaeon]|nr:aminoacyl--tRNA ligase-related protein [Nanoarchaeota archaeon]
MEASKLFAFRTPSFSTDPRITPTYRLMEDAGLVAYQDAGLYTLLPLGSMVMRKIRETLHSANEAAEIAEVDFPTLQKRALWEKSGRWDRFSKESISAETEDSSLIATPTNEEFVCTLLARSLQSYKQLPLRMYQIGDIFKKNTASKGIIRSLVFEVYEAYSFDANEESVKETRTVFESIFQRLFSALQIKLARIEYPEGDFVNYFLPHADGEHKIVIQDGQAQLPQAGERKETVKALSVGMYKVYKPEFSQQFKLTFRNPGNQVQFPIMSTYGIGISRLFFAMVDCWKNQYGIQWPEGYAPFEYAIVPRQQSMEKHKARELYDTLREQGKSVLLDDRDNGTLQARIKTFQSIGIPIIMVNQQTYPSLTLIHKERKDVCSLETLLNGGM